MYNEASVLVTENCNLRCTYCFEKANKNVMSLNVAKQTLDFISSTSQERGQFGFMLFGGEPTMNPEICNFFIEEGYKRAKELGVRFNISMITNCTSLPDSLADTIREYKDKIHLNIQLSIDGIPEVQDKNRITATGAGSWKMVEPTIEKWKEVIGENWPDVLNIHGCLSTYSLPFYYQSYKFFRDVLGIDRVWFLPVCEEPWTEAHVKMYADHSSHIFMDILGRIEKNGLREARNIAPFDREMNGCGSVTYAPCGAGKNFCTVTANGDIYPCHQFYYAPHGETMKIGTVWDGVNNERARIFQDYDGSDLSCGSDCTHGQCYRCIAVNWTLTGSILTQKQGEYCQMMKIDQYFQKTLIEEVKRMGLMDENGGECGQHNSDTSGGCDVVSNASCETVERGECNCNNDNEVLTKILQYQKKILHTLIEMEVEK